MTHRVTGDLAAASQASVVRPIALVYLDFLSEAVRANSTDFTVSWDGHDWLGTGALGTIGAVEETIESKATTLSLSISGVDPELLPKAIGDRYQGRTGQLSIAMLDEAYQIIGTPVLTFEGPMDAMPIEISGSVGTITVTVTDGRADWERPAVIRYTNEDQQAFYPGDKGLEFVPQMVEKQLVWGQ